MSEEKTIVQIVEKVCEDMCNHYCKWPENWKAEEHGGMELIDSGICDECPLNKLQ